MDDVKGATARGVMAAKGELFGRCLAALGGGEFLGRFWVPGRVEFLGKHTDYAGGRSLVCAVERGFAIVVRERRDQMVTVTDGRSGERAEFPLSAEVVPAAGHWSNYPMTVARRVARNFGDGGLRGADVALVSDLPPAAGLSSSSALVVGMFLALDKVNGFSAREAYRANISSREDLGGYLGTVENGQTFGTLAGDRGVGTFGGSQDHTAILCGRPGHVSQYGYCPVTAEGVAPLPGGYTFVIGSSGVLAEKTGAAREKYNRVSLLVSEIVRLWREATGRDDRTLAAAVRSSPEAPQRLREILPRPAAGATYSSADLLERFEQFYEESETVVPAAAGALREGEVVRLGERVARSQAMAEGMLHNQVPETIHLATAARELGAAGASAFGAGFGGSVWALVKQGDAEGFAAAWGGGYRAAFPEAGGRANFFTTGAGVAACAV